MMQLSNETVDSAYKLGYEQGYIEGYIQGYIQSLEKVRRENTFETAIRLIQLGFSDEFIRAATLLSAEEISNIKNGT